MNRKIGGLVALLALICLLSLAAIYLVQVEAGALVRITAGGTVLYELPLEEDCTLEIAGVNGGENLVEIAGGQVAVTHADCPDQICVHQGWIRDGTLPIVCLPNQVIVEIIGGEDSGFDTATG